MKFLISVILFFSSANVWAQDVIINKDGDALKVYGLEVGNTALFYRESQASDAPIKRIEKKEVLMVKYQDGRKEVIGENNPSPTSTSQNTVAVNTVSANATNSERIAAYNNIDVKWLIHPKTIDDWIFSYCRLKVNEESVLESDNVSISIETGELQYNGEYNNTSDAMDKTQVITFTVSNKTNKTVYLDLGNTFFVRGGEAEPYYVPTATSEYGGKTTGGNLNLGAVAGAMGIGGIAGTLANGISLSQTKISGTQTTIYSQRIVSIPPHSSKTLTPKVIIPKGHSSIPWITMGNRNSLFSYITDYKQGDISHWNSTESPLTFSFYLSFAFEETCEKLQTMKVDTYLSDIYAIYLKGHSHTFDISKSMEGSIDNWKKALYFVMYSNVKANWLLSNYLRNKIRTTKSELGGSWESVAK